MELHLSYVLKWFKTNKGKGNNVSRSIPHGHRILSVQATSVASESAFSTSGRVLSIRRTRLTSASLEMCMCLKDHLDAQERKQDRCTLETLVDFEKEILDVEVQENEAIPLSDVSLSDMDTAYRTSSIRRIRLIGYGVLSSSGMVYWGPWVRRIGLLGYGVLAESMLFLTFNHSVIYDVYTDVDTAYSLKLGNGLLIR
ncbi:zinc finger BED domain-containing protein RICESLEEPER 2 [Tanacetum coccineum]